MMKKKIYLAGMIVFAITFFTCGIILIRNYLDERKTNETFDELLVRIDETEELDNEGANTGPGFTPAEKYAEVYAQNQDLVGWVRIEDTVIDYPVMQTKTEPDFYLKRGFDKLYSSYGVPYIAEICDIGNYDNLVLYGHNMKNGSMFTELCKYESKEFYEDHKIIRFDTLLEFGQFEIIAVFKTTVYSEEGFKFYRFNKAEEKSDFDQFVSTCKELSLYDIEASAEYGDKLITLSTCEYSRKNGRFVVVAKKINDEVDDE